MPRKKTPKDHAGDYSGSLPPSDFDRLIERHRKINAAETNLRLLLDGIGDGMEPAPQPEEKQIWSEQR